MMSRTRSASPMRGVAFTSLVLGLWGCGPGFPSGSGGTGTTSGSQGGGGAGGVAGNGGSAGSIGGSGGGSAGAGGATSPGGAGGVLNTGGAGGASSTGGASQGGAGGATSPGGAGGVLNTGGAGGATSTGGSSQGGAGGSTGAGGVGGLTGTTTSSSTFTLTITGTDTETDTSSGPGVQDPPPVTSGSRLRVRRLDGGSGALVFAGFQDTDLGQPCSFQNDEDGVLRCIPDADPKSTIRYLDNNCTQPVIAQSCGSQATYVPVKSGAAGCEANSEPHRVYQAGAVLNPGVTYASLGGSCVVKMPDPNITLRAATEVPPDTFVAATLETEPHGDRMIFEVVTGDDGSRETRHVRDAQVGARCSAQWTSPGQRGCLPDSDLLGSLFYADAQCASPLLVRMQPAGACPAPSFGIARGGDACADVATALAVGSTITPQSLFQGNGQACMSTPVVPNFWTFYQQGAEVPSTNFMNLLRQELGAARLRAAVDTSLEGIPVSAPTAFHDSQRNLDCNVRTFSDGTKRCVPINVATLKFYRDAQCTVPVVTLVQDPVCGVPASTEMILTAPASVPGCTSDVIQHVHSIGAAYNGLSVYRKTNGNGCASLSASAIDAYDLGPEISPDVFPEVIEQID